MSDELRNFNEALQKSANELNSLNAILGQNIKNANILNQVTKDQIDESKKEDEALDKLTKGANNAVKGLIGFSKSLSSSAGSFEPLGQALLKTTSVVGGILSQFGIIGKILGGISKAAGEVGNYMIQSFEKAYSTFEKVSDTGIVDSFSAFEQSAASMGLLFNDFEKTMSKNSKEIALLGGTALTGRKMLETLGAGSEQLRVEFQRLGVNTADAAEFQLSYLSQQQRISKGRLQITDELIAETGKYVKELTLVSRLTGMTRKEADQARQQRMKDPRFQAGILDDSTITSKAKENIQLILDTVQGISPETEKMLRDLVAAKDAIPKSSIPLVNVLEKGQVNVLSIVKRMRSANTDEDVPGIIQDLAKGLKTGSENLNHITAQLGPDAAKGAAQFTVTGKQYSDQYGKMSVEQIRQLRHNIDTQTQDQESSNASIAKIKQDLYKSSQMIEKLSVNSDVVAGLMEKMSEAMYNIIAAGYKAAGMELPKHIQAQQAYRKAVTDRQTIEKTFVDRELKIKELSIAKEKETASQRLKRQSTAASMERTLKTDREDLVNLRSIEEDLKKKMMEEQRNYMESSSGTSGASSGTSGGGGGGSGGSGGGTRGPQPVAAPGGTPGGAPGGTSGGTPGGTPGGESSGGSGSVGAAGSPASIAGAAGGMRPGSGSSIAPGGEPAGSGTSGSARQGPNERMSLSSISSRTGKSAQVNSQYAPAFQQLINYLDSNGYNIYSLGGYNDRNIAGTNQKSVHAYGGAIDINPAENPMGPNLVTDMPPQISQIASSLGLGWGGNWPNKKDAMHFSAAKSEGGSLLQARTGGILSGPNTGYLAQLHGDEAVVSNSVSKQPLNSAVSNMMNSSNKEMLAEIYEEVSDKMERLTEMIAEQTDGQKKYMESKLS